MNLKATKLLYHRRYCKDSKPSFSCNFSLEEALTLPVKGSAAMYCILTLFSDENHCYNYSHKRCHRNQDKV